MASQDQHQPYQHQYERPPSPYAFKFGTHARSIVNEPRSTQSQPYHLHSGFAPLHPDLPNTFYARAPHHFANTPPVPKPSAEDLDILFSTEETQVLYNSGLTTWEMTTLAGEVACGLPGGHRFEDPAVPYAFDVGGGGGVRVDERRWCGVIGKGLWYDFGVRVYDGQWLRGNIRGVEAQDVWSVDCEAVWRETRVALELADRWLKYMAHGPWLGNLVFERREEWMEAEPPSTDVDAYYNVLGPNKKPWRVPGRGKGYDPETVLREIENRLRGRLVWTFMDDGHHPDDESDEGDLYGRTNRYWNDGKVPNQATPDAQREKTFLVIYTHVRFLRVLLNPQSTLAERCHTRWSMAMTMLHELMHAINMAPNMDKFCIPPEPYCGGEWARELGSSGIQSFFGGDFEEAPMTDTVGKTGYKYGMSLVPFPTPQSVQPITSLNGTPVVHFGKTSTVYPVPVAWLSSTLLESFYTTLVAKYGLAAFEAPRILSGTRIHRGFYSAATVAQPLPTAIAALHSTLAPQLDNALSDLAARRAVWSRLRPWYQASHALWSQTPYSNPAARAILAQFASAHTLRYADPHRAEREAYQAHLGMYIYLNVREPQLGDIGHYPRRDWLFQVLALMMLAVLPARDYAGDFVYGSREALNVWTPSQAAVGSGQGVWRFAARRRVYESRRGLYVLPERHEQGHFLTNELGQQQYMGNRLWLLHMALDMKQQGEGTEPLPAALAAALNRELQSLLAQASFLRQDEEWLDWGFEFPAYSEELVTVDEQGGYVPWGLPAGLGAGNWGPGGHMQAMAAQVLGQPWPPPVTRGREPWTKTHFTVSEVGERISDQPGGTNWALAPDDQGGYDVFDVSSIPSTDPNLTLDKVLEKTPLGRQIVSQKLLEVLRANRRWPVGKLLIWKHPQDVAEHDGLDGRNLWHVIGNFVFNLTNFPFPAPRDLKDVALKKKTLEEALGTDDPDVILKRLAPFKCGFLRQAAGGAPTQRAFTFRELGRYIYPEIGMYCAINGGVYDLGRYLHSHPGGAKILEQYAGRDATHEFWAAHVDAQASLKANSALKVGRIVEERPRTDPITIDEIVLFDQVYYIPYFEITKKTRLFRALQPYAGTDATSILQTQNPPDPLRQLQQEGRVFAKLASDTKRQITAEELHKHNHIPTADDRSKEPPARRTSWRVWISIDTSDTARNHQTVFDVTLMMLFGGKELEKTLRPFLGRQCRNVQVAKLLREEYQGFIIGELVQGWPGGVPEGAARKAQSRDFQGQDGRQLVGRKRRVSQLEDGGLSRLKRTGRRGWR